QTPVSLVRATAPRGAGKLRGNPHRLIEDVAQAEDQRGSESAGAIQTVMQLTGDAVRVSVHHDHAGGEGGNRAAEYRGPALQGLLEAERAVAVGPVGVLDQLGHVEDVHARVAQPWRGDSQSRDEAQSG